MIFAESRTVAGISGQGPKEKVYPFHLGTFLHPGVCPSTQYLERGCTQSGAQLMVTASVSTAVTT